MNVESITSKKKHCAHALNFNFNHIRLMSDSKILIYVLCVYHLGGMKNEKGHSNRRKL